MSYILDALRKADAERERGHVPGVHAQPTFAGAAPPSAAARALTQPAWLWGGGAVIVLLAMALAWLLLLGRGSGERAAAATAPSVAARPAPVVAAAAPPAPAAPVVTQASAAAPRAEAPPAAPRKQMPPKPAAPKADAAQQSSEARIYALNELPDEIRRTLPTVTVGGSMYSSTPASRILIINGQVLHEGDKIAPDLVLQQIRLKGAVLAFKGFRYTVAF